MEKYAIISECEQYRYQLRRTWDTNLQPVMFIMLNPSTADADNDDPTIRRCIGFAKTWGYGGIVVVNLFAYRATNPKDLLKCKNPVGDDNLKWIEHSASRCPKVVAAWGNADIVNKLLANRPFYQPLEKLANVHYIELSNSGTPKHPLYLKGDLKPQIFNQ